MTIESKNRIPDLIQEGFEFPDDDYWSDEKWTMDNYSDLMSKYPDEWVAVVDEKVISHGKDGAQVTEEARKKTGKDKFPVIFIECGRHVY